jgi:RNA polymerase sigma-70 factor (ECF subfamily)
MDIDIEKIKAGDPDEWGRFFPDLWRYLMGTALKSKLFVQDDDIEQYCEDLVSDAIEKGLKNATNLYAESMPQLLGFFRKILFNVAYSQFVLLRNKTGHDRPDNWNTIDMITNNRGELLTSYSEIVKEINLLPEGMHQVLWMYGYEGYTHVEIGEKLGISISTSKTQFLRARKKVIERLST